MTTTTTLLSLLSGRGKRCCGKGGLSWWKAWVVRNSVVFVGKTPRICWQNASHLLAKCLASVGKTPRVCLSNAGQ